MTANRTSFLEFLENTSRGGGHQWHHKVADSNTPYDQNIYQTTTNPISGTKIYWN